MHQQLPFFVFILLLNLPAKLGAQIVGVGIFDGPTQNVISTTNTVGAATTFTIDQLCQTIKLELTNPDPGGTDLRLYRFQLRTLPAIRLPMVNPIPTGRGIHPVLLWLTLRIT